MLHMGKKLGAGKILAMVTAFILGFLVTLGTEQFVSRKDAPVSQFLTTNRELTLGALLASQPEELGSVDIAEMNLLCAQGLPGAENLDIDKCLGKINEWIPRIRHEQDRHLYRMKQMPEFYKNSEAYFRCYLMAQTLGEDMGLSYNMDLVNSGIMADTASTRFYRDSRDIFIHGLLSDWKKGTCSTFPVLLAATGRRMGYPIRLMLGSGGHVVCLWESPDGKERFNFDSQGTGCDSKPDEYYRNWPKKATDAEVESEGYMRSLTPSEELAVFLSLRACCLLEHNRIPEAVVAFAHVHRLQPKSKRALMHLAIALEREFGGTAPTRR